MQRAAVDQDILSDVIHRWDLELDRTHPGREIAGSPERSEFRMVVESVKGDLLLVEQISPSAAERKRYIAQCLEELESSGLEEVLPYRKNRHGEQILSYENSFWQLQNFLPSIELERPQYAFEKWRGPVMADFLIALRRHAQNMTGEAKRSFSLKEYAHRFLNDVRRHDPAAAPAAQQVFDLLERDFFSVHDRLPLGFCHGDYHPINIIWTPTGIGAVIDWEFCGIQYELYDAANMVGCLGMEHPDSLGGECVCSFIETLKDSGIYQPVSWQYFYELILANRFGWMSEWLRKKDTEMIRLEQDYWALLMKHREALTKIWNIEEEQ